MTKSILLVGVGGQGTILASKLLTIGLMESGYDVKMSEIHGMSQRGGSVSSQIRYGEKVYSPVIELGGADLMVSFEQMEALRWLEYLRPDGKIIVNDYRINPMPVVSAKAAYPDGIFEELSSNVPTKIVDAAAEAVASPFPIAPRGQKGYDPASVDAFLRRAVAPQLGQMSNNPSCRIKSFSPREMVSQSMAPSASL